MGSSPAMVSAPPPGNTTPPADTLAFAVTRGVSLAGVLAAIPDAALAVLFFLTWAFPAAIRPDLGRDLMLLMVLEFIVVHSAGFMGAVMIGSRPQGEKAFILLGLGGFYTLFVLGFAVAFHSAWPLWSFWGLVVNRMLSVLLKQPPEGEEKVFIQRQWVSGVLLYMGACFVTLFPPIPRLGLTPEAVQALQLIGSGAWVSQPWRVLAFGGLYFSLVALSGLYDHRWLSMPASATPALSKSV